MAKAAAEVGSTANQYQILGKLAVGGMAEIFLARGAGVAGLERYCVLKRILREHASDAQFVQMFIDEARLAAQLQHPSIASVYDIGMLGDSYFFTMEYVHGETVRALIQRSLELGRPLPLACVLAVVAGTAAGLHHAHERHGNDGRPLGIVHRDISPSNLMVSYEGNVKILDFGVAKTDDRRTRTRSGVVKGKIGYMSPEQCQRAPVDRRSDLFSLGVVMWEMLACARLYQRPSDFDTLSAIVHEPVPRPSARRSDVPRAVDDIVQRLLAKSPDDRYQTADDVLAAIEDVSMRSGTILSTSALGHLLRDLFGARTEPWIESGSRSPQHRVLVSRPLPRHLDRAARDAVATPRARTIEELAPGDSMSTDVDLVLVADEPTAPPEPAVEPEPPAPLPFPSPAVAKRAPTSSGSGRAARATAPLHAAAQAELIRRSVRANTAKRAAVSPDAVVHAAAPVRQPTHAAPIRLPSEGANAAAHTVPAAQASRSAALMREPAHAVPTRLPSAGANAAMHAVPAAPAVRSAAPVREPAHAAPTRLPSAGANAAMHAVPAAPAVRPAAPVREPAHAAPTRLPASGVNAGMYVVPADPVDRSAAPAREPAYVAPIRLPSPGANPAARTAVPADPVVRSTTPLISASPPPSTAGWAPHPVASSSRVAPVPLERPARSSARTSARQPRAVASATRGMAGARRYLRHAILGASLLIGASAVLFIALLTLGRMSLANPPLGVEAAPREAVRPGSEPTAAPPGETNAPAAPGAVAPKTVEAPPATSDAVAPKTPPCADAIAQRRWSDVMTCAAELEAHGDKDRAQRLRALARRDVREVDAAELDRKARAALRASNWKEAQALRNQIPPTSTYFKPLSDLIDRAEAEAEKIVQSYLDGHDCAGLRRYLFQDTLTRSTERMLAMFHRALTACGDPAAPSTGGGPPAAAVEPASADSAKPGAASSSAPPEGTSNLKPVEAGTSPPPAPPNPGKLDCARVDVDDLITQAKNQFRAGYAAPALSLMRKLLDCRQDVTMYQLTAIYACYAHEVESARRYFARIPAEAQPATVQTCQNQGVDVQAP